MGSYLSTFSNEETVELKKMNQENGNIDDDNSKKCSDQGGFLYKQPISQSTEISHSRWKLRFFILKKLGLFYYHVNQSVTHDLSHLKNVELGELCQTVDGKSGYKMLFQFQDGFLYTMATPSKSIATLWISQLKQYIDGKQETEMLAGDFFYVFDNYYRDFKKHFVSVNFSTREIIVQDMTFLGNFNLRHCEVSEVTLTSVPLANEGFTFSIVNKETGRTLTLGSSNEDSIKNWKKDLEMACAETSRSSMCQDDTSMVEFYNVLHKCFEDGEKWKHLAIQKPPAKSNDRFLILSFDGGGIRGVIPCLLLERLLVSFPQLLSKVSMVTGTSNGALIAMALAFGHHPHTIREMTELTSKSVFSEQTARYMVSSAKWSNRYLNVFCKETWKDLKMSDALVPCLIPSFCLNPMKVEIFTSFRDEAKDDLVSDVTMKSCAAPTFFPAWKNSVDGGVFAHCPADLALAHAIDDLRIPIERIFILSFSTGTLKRALEESSLEEENTHNYGYYQWASQLPSVIWEGMIEKSTILCQKLLKDRFFRVDPILTKEYPLDKPEVLPEFHTLAKEMDLHDVEKWMEKYLQ